MVELLKNGNFPQGSNWKTISFIALKLDSFNGSVGVRLMDLFILEVIERSGVEENSIDLPISSLSYKFALRELVHAKLRRYCFVAYFQQVHTRLLWHHFLFNNRWLHKRATTQLFISSHICLLFHLLHLASFSY